MSTAIIQHIRSMSHSQLRNYVIPGLTSSMLGAPGPAGTVRLFESSRQHHESIIPHSHRFDFECLVLSGRVRNTIWVPADEDQPGDLYAQTLLSYGGSPGDYNMRHDVARYRYQPRERVHTAGQWYGMRAHEIHSIHFDRDTTVLFFEGPELTSKTVALEPVVDGERVPTFEVRPWMFQGQKGGAA